MIQPIEIYASNPCKTWCSCAPYHGCRPAERELLRDIVNFFFEMEKVRRRKKKNPATIECPWNAFGNAWFAPPRLFVHFFESALDPLALDLKQLDTFQE